ncbi:MAG: ligase-associated DNA damage response DEXH box helicase [Parachlamydiaceae bacterium]|nr:ligase-associated DNA damage response DEXH box helicase [Parachlamydiaceae bacterium]
MKKNENIILQWISKKAWTLFPYQEKAWKEIHEGNSGLISIPTGAGKTYAAYLPALSKLHESPEMGIQILYISPLKALANDLEKALKEPILDLKLPYRVEKNTGDTPASQKKRQKKSPPEILLTTPETLSLMLTQEDAALHFKCLKMIIVDEWHELLGTKRGVLLELALSRIKTWSSNVQIWALTATIGNPEEAASVCVGMDRAPIVVTAQMKREVIIETILPESVEKLPWIGYLGLRMLPYVVKKLDPKLPTLIFTNTRSQAERWFQGIIDDQPDWKPLIALHHSSIDKKSRTEIEENIKSGILSFVVCTSALDLGIDLPAVEKIFQIGSPKSVARLIQRAGRSSHRPLTPCHISLVPTNALQVLEMKAYKMAIKEHIIEKRFPLKKCYDVLLQHIVTCAIGGGIDKMEVYNELKTTSCFSDLTFEEYEYCLSFLITGGSAFSGYSEFRKLVPQNDLLTVNDSQIIRRHKMNIGTITSDSYAVIKLMRGKSLGTIEESFLSQLKPGDNFFFGGKRLKLIQYRDLTAYVRLTKENDVQAAVWGGTGLPFSAPLGDILRKAIDENEIQKENVLLKEIFTVQKARSHLPNQHELLIEIVKSREGWHLFLFPFEGKTIHEGLALIIVHRLFNKTPFTVVTSCNDYGLELLSKKPFDEKLLTPELFNSIGCHEELESLINLHEASKAAFREVARIAGLVFQGFPGKHKSNRQLQMSTGLLFDVLEKYDSENLLLKQAKKETLDKYFAQNRLEEVLERLQNSKLIVKYPLQFTPFSLTLFVERVSHLLSTESLVERIAAIQESWTIKS